MRQVIALSVELGEGGFAGRNKKPNRTVPAEPNRTVSFRNRPEPNAEPNRTGQKHDAFKKRRPNRIEPGKHIANPNRTEAMFSFSENY